MIELEFLFQLLMRLFAKPGALMVAANCGRLHSTEYPKGIACGERPRIVINQVSLTSTGCIP